MNGLEKFHELESRKKQLSKSHTENLRTSGECKGGKMSFVLCMLEKFML